MVIDPSVTMMVLLVGSLILALAAGGGGGVRVGTLLALGVLALVVVGCAQPNTVPTPTPVPLTVAEFAARVCDPVDLDVGVTWGKVRAKLRADIDRAGRIVPPEELVDWYLASLATIKGN